VREKAIYDVMVYHIDENRFHAKWDEFLGRAVKNALPGDLFTMENCTAMKSNLEYLFSQKRAWRYNRVIGVVRILVTCTDVLFEIYSRGSKKFFFNKSIKSELVDTFTVGAHFYRKPNWSNDDLCRKIFEWVNYLVRDNFKNSFTDDEVLKNTLLQAQTRKTSRNACVQASSPMFTKMSSKASRSQRKSSG
jgi:hypothetical protein